MSHFINKKLQKVQTLSWDSTAIDCVSHKSKSVCCSVVMLNCPVVSIILLIQPHMNILHLNLCVDP